MKEQATTALWVLVSSALFFLALEGAASLLRESKPGVSLTFRFLGARTGARTPESADPALRRYLKGAAPLEEQLPALRKGRFVLGNTPLADLATEEARVTVDDPVVGLRFKPSLRVRSAQLRTRLYDAYEPVAYSTILHHGGEDAGDPALLEFLQRYTQRELLWSTDADGYRTTLPAESEGPMVAMIGSSPCVGVFLADDETLASILQRRHPEYRIVNACVNTTSVENHAAMMRDLSERFAGRLAGVIQTMNEKNHDSLEEAIAAVDAIADRLDEAGAGYRVLLYYHYIFATMPDLFRKYDDEKLERIFSQKRAVFAHARARGFVTIDSHELVRAERETAGSAFAGLALYVDKGHPSRAGNLGIAAAIPPPPPPSR